MSIKHPINEFVNLLSSHPFYNASGANYVLDVEAHPSDRLLLELEKKGSKQSVGCIPYIGPLTPELTDQLIKANSKGFHIYYRLQYHRLRECTRFVTDADITNALFLLIDIDFKLPFDINYLFTQLGIRPWAIVQTSVVPAISQRSSAYKRYQALIALDAADSQRLEECRKVGMMLASTIGADPSVYDMRRVARLPGFKNWKGAENGENRGVAKLLPLAKPGIVYTLATLESRAKRAELNADLVRCKGLAPKRATTTALGNGNGNGHSRLVPLSYKEMLRLVGDGKPVASVGNRNQTLVSAAGGLAHSAATGRAGFTIEEAHKQLSLLNSKGCTEPLPAKEIASIHKLLERNIERDSAKLAAELDAKLKLTSQLPTETNTNRNGVVNDIETNQQRFFESYFADDDDYASFLASLYYCLAANKQNDGKVSKLAFSAINRALFCNLIVERFFVVAERIRCVWGGEAWRQVRFTLMLEEGLIANLVEKLYESIECGVDTLLKDEGIAAMLSAAEASVRAECTAVNGVLDKEAFSRLWPVRRKALLTFKFSRATRRDVQQAIAHVISEMQQRANLLIDSGASIAFQNGLLDAATGRFTEGEAWKETLSSMDTELDYELLQRVCIALGKDTLDEYEQLLMSECPAMHSFLEDAFPSQVPTWMLVMNIIGYCMLKTNPFQVFFNFQGLGGSGKGTLGKVITYLCGDSAYHLSFNAIAGDTHGMFACVGRCVAVVDEIDNAAMDAKTKRASWSKLKQVTGGTPIEVRQLYKNPISVKIGTKFILISNEPLELPDTAGAGSRRTVSLKFNEPVPAARVVEDKALEVLSSDEGRGANKIATIAAATLVARYNKGLEMFRVVGSEALEEGMLEYLESSSPIKSHLLRVCKKDEKGLVLVDALLAVVECFVEDNAENLSVRAYAETSRVSKERQVLEALRAIGVNRSKTDNVRVELGKNERVKVVKGIRLDSGLVDSKRVLKAMSAADSRCLTVSLRLGNRQFTGFGEAERVQISKLQLINA